MINDPNSRLMSLLREERRGEGGRIKGRGQGNDVIRNVRVLRVKGKRVDADGDTAGFCDP